jgi:hypothetical protein
MAGATERPFGAHLLGFDEQTASDTGRELLDLAVDVYVPADPVRRNLGVELEGLGERLVGLDQEVMRPLADRLDQLGSGGLATSEMRLLGAEVRDLAGELSELGQRINRAMSGGLGTGTTPRPMGLRAEQLGHRLEELGARVAAVADRLTGMRDEELGFLSRLLPTRQTPSSPPL